MSRLPAAGRRLCNRQDSSRSTLFGRQGFKHSRQGLPEDPVRGEAANGRTRLSKQICIWVFSTDIRGPPPPSQCASRCAPNDRLRLTALLHQRQSSRDVGEFDVNLHDTSVRRCIRSCGQISPTDAEIWTGKTADIQRKDEQFT